MKTFLDLNRKFGRVSNYSSIDLKMVGLRMKRISWDQILKGRYSIIVGRAHFGKTTELRAKNQTLRDQGRASIFFALRNVLGESNFEDALEPTELEVFQAWKQKGGKLIVFADSLDEVALLSNDGIAKSLRKACNAIGTSPEVTWVLSTRPAILMDNVLNVVLQELRTTLYKQDEWTTEDFSNFELDDDLDEEQTDADTDSTYVEDGVAKTSISNRTIEQQLKIYALQPLDRFAVRLYLREKVKILNPDETIVAARKYGLARMIDSPGGLDILGYIKPLQNPPRSLTEVYERILDAIWERHREDPREESIDASPQELAMELQRLAAASFLCDLPNIEISEMSLQYRSGVLSSRLITATTLRESSLKYLLGSPFFIDAGHHQVKLYDDLLPFLAAKHLASLVNSPEQAQQLLNNFSWRAPTGECGINRELLTLAGWLSVFSTHCRELLLHIEPQAVALFGDLRSSNITLDEATSALKRMFQRFDEVGDSIGRQFFTLTTENYWQVKKTGLEPVLVQLYQDYGQDLYARSFLLDVAESENSSIFRELVLDAVAHDYSELICNDRLLEHILALGHHDDSKAIAVALMNQPDQPEDRVVTIVRHIAWRSLNAKNIHTLIVQQHEKLRRGFYLHLSLNEDLVENATDTDLYRLVRGLVLYLSKCGKKSGRTSVEFRADQKLIELVNDLLAVLVERSIASADYAVRLCLVMNKILTEKFFEGTQPKNLRMALIANPLARIQFLKALVHSTDKSPSQISEKVFAYNALYLYVEGDEIILNDTGFSRVIQDSKAELQIQKQESVPHKRKRQHLDVGLRQFLNENLELIRLGKCDRAFVQISEWLFFTVPNSRYSEVDFSALRDVAGDQIDDAVQVGLRKFWREKDPLVNEDKSNSTYSLTIAGLQGLYLDLGNGDNLPNLTKEEIQRAIRYAAFEINGFPKWFWKLVNNNIDYSIEELQNQIANSGRGLVSKEHTETLIRNINAASPEVQRGLARSIWNFIYSTPNIGETTLTMSLAIAVSHGVVEKSALESMSLNLMKTAFAHEIHPTNETLQDDQKNLSSRTSSRKNAVTWAAQWLSSFPRSFENAWKEWFNRNEIEANDFMLSLLADLGQERGALLIQVADKGNEGIDVLKLLYYWTHLHIKVEEDPQPEHYQVSFLTQRHYAQVLRDAIIPAIFHARSEYAYHILGNIRESTTGNSRNYLRHLQFMLRENQNPRVLIEQSNYITFERNLAPKVSSYVEFARAVENDLLDIKKQIEFGDFSLRRFFNGISFARIKTDNDGLALEEDFQSLLGSELKHLSLGRYGVSLESILLGGTRRDVLCQFENYHATIELKMSARWTVPDYLEALEKQLLSQYMMAPNSKIGFFVVVLQTKNRKWEVPGSKKIGFEELLTLLRNKALEMSRADSALHLRVIGIDASPKEDFREQKKSEKGKRI